jgi:transcriptional regulator with XRE-family HTH domain
MIGERLKVALIMRGINQKELADLTGLTESTISHYCRDERGSFTNLKKLCKALGVSADYLLGLDNDKRRKVNGRNKE